ncbi:MAG: hypothetical protein AAF244_01895 [Pseudomonadota bacterium]
MFEREHEIYCNFDPIESDPSLRLSFASKAAIVLTGVFFAAAPFVLPAVSQENNPQALKSNSELAPK